ncbi:MAG: hypothetical protein EOO71_05150 [Myxococcaceae bacterium]|nr:MAG: hypothetical protein EOO71_05150 [Myxococcaceae bacterium]
MTPASPSLASTRPTTSWVRRASKAFLPTVFVLGMLANFFYYRADPLMPVIRSDGYGYHLYLTALFVQHDLSFRTEMADWGPELKSPLGLALDERTGRYLNRFPPGQALLMAPAFLLAHVSAPLVGANPSGYSRPYHVAAALNGLLALLIGLALLRRALEEAGYTPPVVLATLVAVTFGTNLFHYGSLEASMSHAYSFALFAGLLLILPRWYREPTVRRSLLLGFVLGFIALVRNTNGLMALFVLLYGVFDLPTQRARFAFLRANVGNIALALLAFSAVMSILFAYWHYATGRWLVYSYRGYGFRFDQPQVLAVLFSVRKGLFFWAPLWLFAVAGFVRDRERLKPYLLPLALFFILQTFLVSTWWHWPYGSSFGHRAYTEASAVFAFGIAGFLTRLRQPATRRLVGGIFVLLVLLQGFLMLRYAQERLKGDRTTWAQYRSLFTVP